MQTGAPTFGTPEPAKVLYGCAKLARRLGVPFRLVGRSPGQKQRMRRRRMSPPKPCPHCSWWGQFCSTFGWMDGRWIGADYAKLILDADQLTMVPKLVNGIDLTDNGQAMDALRETGPGQHFLGSAHTQANFEDAFWRSELADNTTMNNGRLRVVWKAPSARARNLPICWNAMLRLRLTRRLTRPCAPLLHGGWRNCQMPTIKHGRWLGDHE